MFVGLAEEALGGGGEGGAEGGEGGFLVGEGGGTDEGRFVRLNGIGEMGRFFLVLWEGTGFFVGDG